MKSLDSQIFYSSLLLISSLLHPLSAKQTLSHGLPYIPKLKLFSPPAPYQSDGHPYQPYHLLPPTPPHIYSPEPHQVQELPFKQPLVTHNDYNVPTNYDFVYSVHDEYTGDEHSHTEKKTDYVIHGKYSVRLPDGRTQVVSYTADDDGYHPTVEYKPKGESHYLNYPKSHPQHLHQSDNEPIYKYSPTPGPYPAKPKAFRPEANLYNPPPNLYKYISNTPLKYKGKLVFLGNKNQKEENSPPLLPPLNPSP